MSASLNNPPIIWTPGPSSKIIATNGLTIDQSTSSKLMAGKTNSIVNHIINGGLIHTTRTITANLTIDTTTNDFLILLNNSGAITVTLPVPTNGRVLILKDIAGTAGTNNITLARNAAEKIEGIAASRTLQTNWGSWSIYSNGTDWFIL